VSKTGYRLKGNQKVYILPIGDLHIGSPEFNEGYFDYCLDKIDELTSPYRIYLMGDLLETATKQVANSSFQSTMSAEEQVETAISYLKPFRRDIFYCCIGNHESRLIKEFNYNILHRVGKALRCPVGYQFIDSFNINGDPLRVYVAHGKGSSAHFYTAQSKMLRDTSHVDSDIFINGHNHRCGYFSVPNLSREGILRRHYAFSGAFLKYGGYAEAMQLPILPEAFIQLSINKERRVRNNPFYIDEVRPDLLEL
jgi:UDP-2,3-diacylglucosamine pyrophosphatase LpxH